MFMPVIFYKYIINKATNLDNMLLKKKRLYICIYLYIHYGSKLSTVFQEHVLKAKIRQTNVLEWFNYWNIYN